MEKMNSPNPNNDIEEDVLESKEVDAPSEHRESLSSSGKAIAAFDAAELTTDVIFSAAGGLHQHRLPRPSCRSQSV